VTHCFDVYGAEVDDKGIDFVVRRDPAAYFDIQVKSLRGLGYVFFPKDCFDLRASLYAVLVLFEDGRIPDLYLLPSLAWQAPSKIFVSRDYLGKKSRPEWELTSLARISLSLNPIALRSRLNSCGMAPNISLQRTPYVGSLV